MRVIPIPFDGMVESTEQLRSRLMADSRRLAVAFGRQVSDGNFALISIHPFRFCKRKEPRELFFDIFGGRSASIGSMDSQF